MSHFRCVCHDTGNTVRMRPATRLYRTWTRASYCIEAVMLVVEPTFNIVNCYHLMLWYRHSSVLYVAFINSRNLRSTQPLKMISRDFSWDKGGRFVYSWRPTILVVPNVEMIRGLNLPGTHTATSACRGTPLPLLSEFVTFYIDPKSRY